MGSDMGPESEIHGPGWQSHDDWTPTSFGDGNSSPASMPEDSNGSPTSRSDGGGFGHGSTGLDFDHTSASGFNENGLDDENRMQVADEKELKPLEQCTESGDPIRPTAVDLEKLGQMREMDAPTIGPPVPEADEPYKSIAEQQAEMQKSLDVLTGGSIGAIAHGLGVPPDLAAAIDSIVEGIAGTVGPPSADG